MKNADYIDKNGFFVGNHHFDIRDKIEYFYEVIGGFLK
jgi:CDP-6-deoxy-D-xylo-4-hexulose-3-dehydrase